MRSVKLTASLFAVAFCLALGAAPAGALTFTPPAHYRVGSHPADLATGDLNGDGLPDIAVAVAGSDSVAGDGSVAILLATGNGRFAPPVRVPLGHAPRSIALGDLNGDGALDVVTATDRLGRLRRRPPGERGRHLRPQGRVSGLGRPVRCRGRRPDRRRRRRRRHRWRPRTGSSCG